MSISWSRPCAVRRIAPSSRPHRSSARPRHQECGTVPCASRRVRNRRAFNHPHPVRQSHTRPAGRWASKPPRQPPHTRREQKIAAPMRQQSLSSRSWPQHGAWDRSTPRQSEEAAATRRHPLVPLEKCPGKLSPVGVRARDQIMIWTLIVMLLGCIGVS